ncbi:50S ribosomal protein L11 methyltransferase [Caldisalinibacter kiritimatiensis]|uniref:Ribosomal protein L11 methyltransferase n=1 Tax=Caldisalinibacter kiritimatiensis TaxID=1304284 RepID=R1CER9_9FIRM|nr:50S ribosomal protein L11 methyltransferase [Caldisalinibacter kiritimatiensis]EOD00805.1 Ribosomal protein L11 methyltransferase [Caldisalinibacter kiritimatiensis]
MKWIEVQIKTTTEAVEAVSNILYESGVGGLVIEDPNDIIMLNKSEEDWDYVDPDLLENDFEGVIVKGYLPESEDLIDKIELIKQNVEKIPQYNLDKGLGEVTTSEVYEKDWSESWKKYYKPKKIGERIVIKPSWEEYSKKDDEIVIEIDPGMAFGTGTHETTSMCLIQLEKHVHKHDIVFDVGCGTGILSIAAAKLGAINAIGVDLDDASIIVAKENVRKNGVSNIVQIRHGDLLDKVEGKANVIVANIIAEVIVKLAKYIPEYLLEDGVFITSGIILEKENLVKDALEKEGLQIIDRMAMGEWVCLAAKLKEGNNHA